MTRYALKPLVGAALAVISLCSAGSANAQDAYLIGVSGAMTGSAAATYAPVVESMRAYIDHINGKGGVNGRQVKLVISDNQGEASKAAANAKKLLTQDKVVMLVNASLSSTYAPMVAEAKRANVPLFYAGCGVPEGNLSAGRPAAVLLDRVRRAATTARWRSPPSRSWRRSRCGSASRRWRFRCRAVKSIMPKASPKPSA